MLHQLSNTNSTNVWQLMVLNGGRSEFLFLCCFVFFCRFMSFLKFLGSMTLGLSMESFVGEHLCGVFLWCGFSFVGCQSSV
jgi:hypothetical protein